MSTRAKGVPVVAALVWLWASAAGAEESRSASPDFSLTLGLRGLYTTGTTSWSSRVSELTWRGADSAIGEVNAEVVWKRLVGRASFGLGGIDQGVLIDVDFAPASRTRSEVTGDGLFYTNLDVGARLSSWGAPRGVPGFLDVLIGFQYWREEYEANGATGTVVVSPSLKSIRNEFNWSSVRVGGRAQIPIVAGLAATVSGFVIPWSHTEREDTHFRRTDLKQPSFVGEANGGFGYQLEAGLSYRIVGGLSAEAGFRYWKIDSGSGDDTARLVTGDLRQRLKEVIIERYGPYLGVTYRF